MLLLNRQIILLEKRLLLGYLLFYDVILLLAHVFLLHDHILNVIFDLMLLAELLYLVLTNIFAEVDFVDTVEQFGELADEFDAEHLQVTLAQ